MKNAKTFCTTFCYAILFTFIISFGHIHGQVDIQCPTTIMAQPGGGPLAPGHHFPLMENYDDVLGNLSSFQTGTQNFNNGALCIDGEFNNTFRTATINDLDWTKLGISTDVKVNELQQFRSFANYNSIWVFSTSFRNLGLLVDGDNGELVVVYNNVNIIQTNLQLNLDQWYSLELLYDNGIVELYVDGNLLLSQSIGPLQTSVMIGSSLINADRSLSNRHFGGFAITANACYKNLKIQTPTAGTSAVVNYAATSNSPDASISYSIDPGSQFSCGATPVTATATLPNGDSNSCTFDVIVPDLIEPEALCQDLEITLGSNLTATISAADIDAGSNDNCMITALNLSKSTFTCEDLGSNEVQLSVSDNYNNLVSCSANVELTLVQGDPNIVVLENLPALIESTNGPLPVPPTFGDGLYDLYDEVGNLIAEDISELPSDLNLGETYSLQANIPQGSDCEGLTITSFKVLSLGCTAP